VDSSSLPSSLPSSLSSSSLLSALPTPSASFLLPIDSTASALTGSSSSELKSLSISQQSRRSPAAGIGGAQILGRQTLAGRASTRKRVGGDPGTSADAAGAALARATGVRSITASITASIIFAAVLFVLLRCSYGVPIG
jgi:hypothetical protein